MKIRITTWSDWQIGDSDVDGRAAGFLTYRSDDERRGILGAPFTFWSRLRSVGALTGLERSPVVSNPYLDKKLHDSINIIRILYNSSNVDCHGSIWVTWNCQEVPEGPWKTMHIGFNQKSLKFYISDIQTPQSCSACVHFIISSLYSARVHSLPLIKSILSTVDSLGAVSTHWAHR